MSSFKRSKLDINSKNIIIGSTTNLMKSGQKGFPYLHPLTPTQITELKGHKPREPTYPDVHL